MKGSGVIGQCLLLPLLVILVFPVVLCGQDEYTFKYFVQMEDRGKILNILPYRFFHEASASVRFLKTMDEKGLEDYRYLDIDGPGYVMTTGGLNGNSLYFFTADYDMDRAQRFREERIGSFLEKEPGYAKTIRKIRRRPMTILSRNPEDVTFKRNPGGRHLESRTFLRLTESQSQTYSNIYEILAVLLLAYNHSFLPAGGWDGIENRTSPAWESVPLDFTPVLRDFAALASEAAKKQAHFDQEKPFPLNYEVKQYDPEGLTIVGEAFPDVRIRRGMNLKHVVRTVLIEGREVRRDVLLLEFGDVDDRRGSIFLKLERAEGEN